MIRLRILRRVVALGFWGSSLASCSSTETTTQAQSATAVRCDEARGAVTSVAGFSRYTIDASTSGPGWISIADMNGDGRDDLVVSSLGPVVQDGSTATLNPGAVDVYLQGDSPSCWQKQPLFGAEAKLYFPNQTTVRDLDGDGDLDVFVPSGFFVCTFDTSIRTCGGLTWFERDGDAWRRHDVIPPGDFAFYHQGAFADLDGDGLVDLVTVAETISDPKTVWFRGTTTPDRFEPKPRVIGEGGGSLPILHDVDGDGDLDALSAQYFGAGPSFAWYEQVEKPGGAAPDGRWERHGICDDCGKGFQIQVVPNLFGDGRAVPVGTNHTNTATYASDAESAVFAFEPGAEPRARWKWRTLSSGIVSRANVGSKIQGAPGVFGHGDIDGDGDVDLAVAGDGDARTFWLEQTSPGSFVTHVLEETLGQAAGAKVHDVDGDGRADLVFTGYEASAVFLYATRK